MVERVRARLHLLPRYRQRLRSPAPGIANPAWIDDEDFDLGRHVRAATLPAPGDDERLGEFVGTSCRGGWTATGRCGSSRSSRAWRAAGRRSWPGCTTRWSTASRRWTSGRCSWIRRPSRSTCPRPRTGRRGRYDRIQHLARLSLQPAGARAAAAVGRPAARARPTRRRAADELRRATDDLRSATEVALELARTRPQAPPTPAERRHRAQPPLRDRAPRPRRALKAVAKPRGATVNDAVLAIVAGMLRRYLLAAGTPLRPPPVALVPVSVRRAGDEGRQPHLHGARRAPGRRGRPRRAAATRCIGAPGALKDSAAVRAGALARRGDRLGAPAHVRRAGPQPGRRARVQPRRLQRARARSSRSTSTASGSSRCIPPSRSTRPTRASASAC